MASKVDICNRALTKLGAQRILSLSDDLKPARECNSAFDIVRDAELRNHTWSFSKTRASLAALAAAPAWGFSRQFQLPNDCLRVVRVGEYYPGPVLDDYVNSNTADYAIEGRRILTDYDAPLKILYIARVTDATQYDSAFIEALACRLAMELAEPLTQSNTKRELAQSEYRSALLDAVRANAIELPPEQTQDDAWNLARL